jgi:MSHA biogenesis protein MshN
MDQMSLINQMLKDIEQRQLAAPLHSDVLGQLYSAKVPRRSPLWWRLGAGCLVVVGMGWYAYRVESPALLAQAPTVPVLSAAALPETSPVAAPVTVPVTAPDIASVPLASATSTATTTVTPTTSLVLPNAQASLATASAFESILVPKSAASAARSGFSAPDVPLQRPEPVGTSPGTVTRVSTPEQRADNLYREALPWVQQGRWVEAQNALKLSLESNPNQHEARQLLARVYADSDQLAEAKALLVEGMTRTPQRLEFAMALAQTQLQSNDLNAAVQTLQQVQPVAADKADFYAFLAALMQRQGRHEEAKQHYLTALRQVPDNANWLVGLGISLQAQQIKLGAVQAYQRAIDLGLPPTLVEFAQKRLRQLEDLK